VAGGRVSAWMYVLRCGDGSLYTGWTNQLEKRIKTHQVGKGAKYTRSRLPVRLVGAWKKRSRREAMRGEALFKQLTRPEKLAKLSQWRRKRTSARVRSRAEVSRR
jgi:putative endonuclease